jgi:hypothetical protein
LFIIVIFGFLVGLDFVGFFSPFLERVGKWKMKFNYGEKKEVSRFFAGMR